MKEGEQKEPMSKELSLDQQHLEIAKQQLEIYKETLKAAQKQAGASASTSRAAWLAALAAILAGVIAFWPLLKAARGVESTAQDVKSIEKAVLSSKLVISSPSNGDQVTSNEVISGFTPYPKRNHYVVITPLKVGDSYVQDRATVRADGTWTGNAIFGSGEVGLNERFTVRCLATEAELRTGSLGSQPVPPDAVFASPVTVTRTH
ncbi:MAG: hypothetical protein AABN34_22970 [Acidobacteriota bacterium]